MYFIDTSNHSFILIHFRTVLHIIYIAYKWQILLTLRFQAARHGNTHYRVYGTQDGPSAKGLVVLSPALGVSHHAFEAFAKILVES